MPSLKDNKKSSKRSITIFDLDHTLAVGNVSFAFGKYLFRKRFFSRAKLVPLIAAYALQRVHFLSVQSLHAISFYFLFSQVSVAAIKKQACEFIENYLSGILRQEIVEEMRLAKERGDEIWLESSSPDFLVSLIAEKLQVDGYLATHYQEDLQGRYDKIGQVVDGQVKWQHLKELLETSGRTTDQVTAYSDSIVDLPLLEKVGVAIAVHPEKKLNKVACKKLWKIIN